MLFFCLFVSSCSLIQTFILHRCHPQLTIYCREELNLFVSTGILTLLHVSFSRPDPQPSQEENNALKYVQDNMRARWRELAKWIMEDNAVVYVCG